MSAKYAELRKIANSFYFESFFEFGKAIILDWDWKIKYAYPDAICLTGNGFMYRMSGGSSDAFGFTGLARLHSSANIGQTEEGDAFKGSIEFKDTKLKIRAARLISVANSNGNIFTPRPQNSNPAIRLMKEFKMTDYYNIGSTRVAWNINPSVESLALFEDFWLSSFGGDLEDDFFGITSEGKGKKTPFWEKNRKQVYYAKKEAERIEEIERREKQRRFETKRQSVMATDRAANDAQFFGAAATLTK